jgi:membrane associated rhomboid family serine protease
MFPFADTNPTKRWEIVTYIIVAINVLVFVWFQQLPPAAQQKAVLKYGFIPARIEQLRDPQKVVQVEIEAPVARLPGGHQLVNRQAVPLPANRTAILTSIVTCMFMHGGWLHLLGNMWFLLLFGNNIEDRLGHGLYLIFYFLGGFAATAAQWVVDPGSTTPMIGASGAVAAVLGAYAITFPHARLRTLIFLVFIITVVELPAYLFLILWFGMQLLEGIGALQIPIDGLSGGVAWWAHIGGFVVGAILMPLFSLIAPDYDDPPSEAGPFDRLHDVGDENWSRDYRQRW